MAENSSKPSTNTQIRNFYSETSYLNTKFYNINLSFSFYPILSKDQNGKRQYDMKNGQTTTIDFEGASALYDTIQKIVDGKINECSLMIPCNGAELHLDRSYNGMGFETLFKINKNGMEISYKFKVDTINIKENGQNTVKTIESGLIAFNKTIEGYLTGINADRHLNKLTDDYVASQNVNNGNNGWKGNNYNNNNNRKNYNGNYNKGGYNNNRKNYNNNNNQQWHPQSPAQNMSTYQIQN